jgi:hypothetical protein
LRQRRRSACDAGVQRGQSSWRWGSRHHPGSKSSPGWRRAGHARRCLTRRWLSLRWLLLWRGRARDLTGRRWSGHGHGGSSHLLSRRWSGSAFGRRRQDTRLTCSRRWRCHAHRQPLRRSTVRPRRTDIVGRRRVGERRYYRGRFWTVSNSSTLGSRRRFHRRCVVPAWHVASLRRRHRQRR